MTTSFGQPAKWPLCSDANEFLYAESAAIITQHSLPHRAVWGMLHSPARNRWLVRRQEDLGGFWDISCGDHVVVVGRQPETYQEAYARALRTLYSLETAWIDRAEAERGRLSAPSGKLVTVDLGYSKEYNWTLTRERELHLEREHVNIFLTICDGDVTLRANNASTCWVTADQMRSEIDANNCVGALIHAFELCMRFVRRYDLRLSKGR